MKTKAIVAISLTVLFIFSLTIVLATNPQSNLLGDVDGNGKIDKYDYILVKRFYFETISFDSTQLLAADVNIDGEVDVYDYLLLKRHHFGTYIITGEIDLGNVSEPISNEPDISDESETSESSEEASQENSNNSNAGGGIVTPDDEW